MGNLFGCIDEAANVKRLDYDMTPVKSKRLPIVWMIGPPGTGRHVFAYHLCKDFEYEHVRVSDLIKNESLNDTDRGRIVKNCLENDKRVADAIVVDLIKETMLLKAQQATGYLINGFPRTAKQALTFASEIGNVDCIIYLYGKVDEMVHRVHHGFDCALTDEAIRKNIVAYMKEIKEATQKFAPKIEKIYIEKPERDCYSDIEAAIGARIADVKSLTKKKQVEAV